MSLDSKDEIGSLVASVNEMNVQLSGIVRDISEASVVVSSQSGQLQASSKELKAGSEQIASTMQELSSGAETQASSASDLSETMGELMESIYVANQSGEAVAKASGEVLTHSYAGYELMNESVNQMNRINGLMETTVEKVEHLDEQSEKISTLVDVIQSIADQTNLLALNAAIEAARAGSTAEGLRLWQMRLENLLNRFQAQLLILTRLSAMSAKKQKK